MYTVVLYRTQLLNSNNAQECYRATGRTRFVYSDSDLVGYLCFAGKCPGAGEHARAGTLYRRPRERVYHLAQVFPGEGQWHITPRKGMDRAPWSVAAFRSS